jgi:peptidoglycan/LPS O-acetylase OafA/YrhL
MTYRPDIDGLRAVAVLCVVLFHVGTNYSNGGFVGVDVFFVISGYLITRTIDREISAGRFSLVAFYERRARRIFPALFAVLGVTFAAALVLLPPADFLRCAQSLIATSLFVSNIFFIGEAQRGLLDGNVPLPLLHTWSLAVEEQFYLIFPLLLTLLTRRASRKERIGLLWLLTLASLILSTVLVKASPVEALYLAQSRAWELLFGVLLALDALPDLRARSLREALGIAGLLLIVAGAVLYTTKTPFPGLAALPPALGAVLVIASGNGASGDGGKTLVSRLLSSRIAVGLGLISYSLYVWHWPIMTMTDLLVGHPLTKLQKVAVVALCIGVAALSWRYVEGPFRRRGAGAVSRAPTGTAKTAPAERCLEIAALGSADPAGAPNRDSHCAPK